MDNYIGHLDLNSLGLDHKPLVRAAVIEVDPPTLRDNTGLADRLTRAAAKIWNLDDVVMPLSLAKKLNDLYVSNDYRIWVACHIQEEKGRLIDLRPANPDNAVYALAVDIGSTTLVFALVDLERPCVIDQMTRPNPQVAIGSDILTRVHYSDKPGGLRELVEMLREAIGTGAEEICRRNGLSSEQLLAASMAGNTTMTHFLLGLPVRTLIREPYVPVLNRPADLSGRDLGLNLANEAPVAVMPNKGSYFGGDLIAGLVVGGFARSDELCLMVDVGTNAEVVLGTKDWLICAAGAAGPALEGGVASMGMVAAPGAIEWVRIDRKTGDVKWRTIGGVPPVGICGSGLIDLFAEMFLSGVINFQGRIALPETHPRRVMTDEGPAFIVAFKEESGIDEPIIVTDIELDILTRSKAGMYTILHTVMKSVGFSFDQIAKFYVAGTFGQYIDPKMAVAVGMIPDIPMERYISLGNSSLKGAVLMLTSEKARQEAIEVWKKLTYLEMNVNQELMNRFSAARFIPHTDRERFPSVGTTII